MVISRAPKRVRVEMTESFWEEEELGVYLTVSLKSGTPIKGKGWPWVQGSIRGILGGQDRVAKASFQRDGGLLLKTKSDRQTNLLLKATTFGEEECVVPKGRQAEHE